MEHNYNQNNESPRYIEIGPNGQVIRQEPTVPPEVVANYLTLRESMSYNGTSLNEQWSSSSTQPSFKKQWWQSNGSYDPYRTTYQKYFCRSNNQSNTMSNGYNSQPDVYSQGSSAYTATCDQSGTMPYDLPRSPHYM